MSEEELKQIAEEEYESPYCEVCGHCGEIGCCGIRNFIEEHIKGKTNCKNEDIIINELIDLCDYKDEVFEENEQLKDKIDKAIKELKSIFPIFTLPSREIVNWRFKIASVEKSIRILGDKENE